MKTYIGMKVVQATPVKMVNGIIWPENLPIPEVPEEAAVPAENNAVTPRFIVEEGYTFIGNSGYPEYVPKAEFEEAYRETSGMNFGLAIEAAKMGKKIARNGWNGKGMWVVYRTGYPDGIPCNKNTADAVGIPEGTMFKVRPYLQMKCVDDSFQMWLASQSDILADDWYIVE